MSDPDIAQRAAPEDAPRRTPTWGLGDAAIGFLLAQFGGILMVSLVMAVNDVDDPEDLSLAWLNVGQIGLWLPLVGVTVWAAWLKGNGVVRDFGLRIKAVDVPLGVVGGFVTQYAIGWIYVPIFWLTDTDVDDLEEAARDITDRATDGFGSVMVVILVVIGAPIVEELFWRGLVLRSFERRFGPVVAVVASGVLFGLAHTNNPLGMPGLILFGMFLGYLAVRTGRLGAPILAHMAFNTVTVVNLLSET